MEKNNIVLKRRILVHGSGVNLDEHSYNCYPLDDECTKILYIGRIMKAKGIDEFLEASEIIKENYSNVEFHIIGFCEENYKDLLEELGTRRIIHFHGYQDDVKKFIKESHAVINPSYHEGMSNVLLEAASTGRPVLASKIPGCEETFDEGISGLGFESKNVDNMVYILEKFINLPYEQKKQMGIAGRKKMEKEFDRKIVVNSYLDEINKILEGDNNESV